MKDDITEIMGFVKTDTNSHVMKPDSMHKANDSQKITITSSTAAETLASLNSLPEGVTIDSEGSVTLDIDTLLQNPNSLLELKQLIGDNEAVNQAMLGAALKELNNAKNNAPIIPADFCNNSFGEEDFRDIAAKYQDNKAIVLIAASFVNEDGKWDRAEFLEFLNKCAGDRSILNREELIAGVHSKMAGERSDIGKTETVMVSREQIERLQPKMKMIIRALVQVDLVKDVYGNFDLTQLSKVIEDCIGADKVLNKANKKRYTGE